MGRSYCLTPIPLAPSCRVFSRAGCLISISAPQTKRRSRPHRANVFTLDTADGYTAVPNGRFKGGYITAITGTLMPVSMRFSLKWRSPSIWMRTRRIGFGPISPIVRPVLLSLLGIGLGGSENGAEPDR